MKKYSLVFPCLLWTAYVCGTAVADKGNNSKFKMQFPLVEFADKTDTETYSALGEYLKNPGELAKEVHHNDAKEIIRDFETYQVKTPEGILAVGFEARVVLPFKEISSVWYGNWKIKGEWVDSAESYTLVDIMPLEAETTGKRRWGNVVRSLTTDLGMFVWRRSFVGKTNYVIDPQGRWMASITAHAPDARKIFEEFRQKDADKKQYLGTLFFLSTYMKEESPTTTLLQFTCKADPAGSLPKMLVNYLVKSWSWQTIEDLTSYVVKRKNYQVIDYFDAKYDPKKDL